MSSITSPTLVPQVMESAHTSEQSAPQEKFIAPQLWQSRESPLPRLRPYHDWNFQQRWQLFEQVTCSKRSQRYKVYRNTSGQTRRQFLATSTMKPEDSTSLQLTVFNALNLQHRQKWSKDRRNARINDIVILQDDTAPRNQWKLAKVTEVYPGQDGRVRRFKLLISDSTEDERGKRITKPTYLERPIHKTVTLLEADQETCRPLSQKSLVIGGSVTDSQTYRLCRCLLFELFMCPLCGGNDNTSGTTQLILL